MRKPKAVWAELRAKTARLKDCLRRGKYRGHHEEGNSLSQPLGQSLQTRQDVIDGASPLTGVETEGATVKHPGPEVSQPALHTSEQIKASASFESSEEVPNADSRRASSGTATRITPALAASAAPISLWGAAYKKLRKDEPELMEAFGNALLSSQPTKPSSDHEMTSGGLPADKQGLLQALANRQLDELSQKRYRLSVGEKDIVVRDQFKKILKVVLTFKDLISSAIAAEPVAALAWSGISFALQLLDKGMQEDENAASGLAYVTDLMIRFKMIEEGLWRLNFSKQHETASELVMYVRRSTINLYTKIYKYQVCIIQHYGSGAVTRLFKDVVGITDWKVLQQEMKTIDQDIAINQRVLYDDIVQRMGEALNEFDAKNMRQHAATQQAIKGIQEGVHIKDLDQYFQQHATFVHGSPIEGCKPSCLEGTRTANLQSIQEWIQDDDGPAIYWLSAMSGTGKSTIARTIAATLGPESNKSQPSNVKCSLAASFFFSKGDDTRNTAQHVFTTITRCLTLHRPELTRFAAEACAELDHVMSKGFSGLWDVLVGKLPEFVEASQTLKNAPERWIVVIDALDECKDTSGFDIRHMLKQLSQCNARLKNDLLQIRFLITSRTENHIERAFDRLKPITYRKEILERVNVEGFNRKILRDNDIAIFLRFKLRRIAEEQLSPPDERWPGEDAIEKLAKKSQGLFIYAATCCRFLERCARQRLELLLKDTDDKIDDNNSPQGQLFKIYGQIIEASMDNDKWTMGERQDLNDILGSLVALAEPVSLSVLQLLLPRQRDLDNLDERLEDFQSVINVPRDDRTPVTVHHLSFHNFLVHEQTRKTYPWLWIDEMKTNTRILDRCIKILEEGLKSQDICDVRLPDVEVDELSQNSVQQRIPLHVQYACRYWFHHLSRSGAALTSEIACKVYDFLKSRFLFWVEAMAWMKDMSATIAVLNQLLANFTPAVAPASGDSIDYVSLVAVFAKDARRFLLANRSIIESAPLQLYCSALLFSPSKSVIRHLYGADYIPSWIKRHPRVEEHWTPRLFDLGDDGYTDLRISEDTTVIAAVQLTSPSICLWNINTGAKMSPFTLNGQDVRIRSITLSGRGDAMSLACVHEKTSRDLSNQASMNEHTCLRSGVIIWNVASRDVILEAEHIGAQQVEFSPDGRTVTSVSWNGTIKSWKIGQDQTCEVRQSTIPWQERLRTRSRPLEISPGGQKVVFDLTEPDGIGIWNIQADVMETELLFNDLVHTAWSIDGSLLAAISGESKRFSSFLEIWSVSTWEPTIRVHFQEDLIYVAISPDNSVLALRAQYKDRENVIMLVKASDGGKLWTSTIQGPISGCLSFSPDGQYLAATHILDGIMVWDVAICKLTGDESRTNAQATGRYDGSRHFAHTLKTTSDGEILHAIGQKDSQLFSTVNGVQIAQEVTFEAANFSPDGRSACLFNPDSLERHRCSSHIRLWDMIEDRELQAGEYTGVQDFSLSNGILVLLLDSGGSNQEIRVVSIDNKRTLHSLHLSDQNLSRIFHLGSAAEFVAYTTSDKRAEEFTLNSWHLATNTVRRMVMYSLSYSWKDPECLFSPNGKFFVHACGPEKWQLREVPTGAMLFEETLVGGADEWGKHFKAFPTFSADGRFLAIPEFYDTVTYQVSIWRIPSGVRETLVGPKRGSLESVALSASGNLLFISHFGPKELWDLESDRCWSAAEWTSGLHDSKTEILFSENCCHLRSSFGMLPLPSSVRISAGERKAQANHNAHLWFAINDRWLMHGSERLLWFPSDYHPHAAAVQGSTVAAIGKHDWITFLEFSLADIPITSGMLRGVCMTDEYDCGLWTPGLLQNEEDDDEEIESNS